MRVFPLWSETVKVFSFVLIVASGQQNGCVRPGGDFSCVRNVISNIADDFCVGKKRRKAVQWGDAFSGKYAAGTVVALIILRGQLSQNGQCANLFAGKRQGLLFIFQQSNPLACGLKIQLTVLSAARQIRSTGKHVDGVIFSASSFGQKVGTGVGTALTGWLLSYGGYVGTAAEQSASAISMISFMYLIIPIIGYGIAYLIFWQLKVEQANAELDAKAAAAKA